MKKTTQIRDIDLIEKELLENYVGVLAVTLKNEKVIQSATTFLYLDKNIYVFFENDNELYEDINLEINGSFIILKSNNSTIDSIKYHILSISISGAVKKVEDKKILEELKKNFGKKYSADSEYMSTIINALIIDTEEILALEEQGE